jgi:uncharacterized membrane protein YciS (DUF1049 family)
LNAGALRCPERRRKLGAAFSKDPGGKAMDNQTLVHQTGQARGKLMRLEQDLGRAKVNLDDATRNRIVGGVVLLIGLLALIGFFMRGSQLVAIIAAAGLFIGGLVLIRALVKIGGAHRSIDTMTDQVANAQAKLDDLTAQPSSAVVPNAE